MNSCEFHLILDGVIWVHVHYKYELFIWIYVNLYVCGSASGASGVAVRTVVCAVVCTAVVRQCSW
jgi:hypothetical protein